MREKFRKSYRQPAGRTPRDQALTEWRRVDLRPLERAASSTAKSIQNVIPGVLKELGLEKRQTDLEILKVWNHLIDPNIVAHARPTNLHKGTLFVTVDSSVWLDEIVRYRRKEILARLQHSFGRDLVVKISFRVG